MPRDARLYQTYPIDFHRHPKVTRLSVLARWTFVEMNGEARCAENDGRFSAEEAEFLWEKIALDELVASHPSRPLVMRVGDDYVIRDYAEHQFTKADREELSRKRAEAGAKGAAAKASKRQASAEQVLSKVQQPPAESESGDFYSRSESQSLDNRARVSTDAIEVSAMTKGLAAQKGITSLRVVVDAVHRHTSARITADQAFQLCLLLLDKAKVWPDAEQRYVLACIRDTPAEVEKHLYEQIGVAS